MVRTVEQGKRKDEIQNQKGARKRCLAPDIKGKKCVPITSENSRGETRGKV
jgi:hypothetical protein